MQVTHKGIPQEMSVTSVTLLRDELNPLMLSNFHCTDCGRLVGQYKGGYIVDIFVGDNEIEQQTVPWIAQCRHCKKRFLIRSIALSTLP